MSSLAGTQGALKYDLFTVLIIGGLNVQGQGSSPHSDQLEKEIRNLRNDLLKVGGQFEPVCLVNVIQDFRTHCDL